MVIKALFIHAIYMFLCVQLYSKQVITGKLWHLACLIAAGIYTIHMPIRSQDVYSVLWLSNLIT